MNAFALQLATVALLVRDLIDTRHERAKHDRAKNPTLQARRVTRRFIRARKSTRATANPD